MKKAKSLVVFILTVIITTLYVSPVSANSISETNSQTAAEKYYELLVQNNKNENSCALLTDENGNSYFIDAFESDEMRIDGNRFRKGYAFKIESDVLSTEVERGTLSTATNGDYDDTGSIYGYIELTYNRNGTSYLLTNVSGSWTSQDSFAYTSNRSVIYCCTKPSVYLSQWGSQSGLGAYWSVPTGFSTYVDSTGLATLGARAFATINRPSGSSWDFSVECKLFDNFMNIFS